MGMSTPGRPRLSRLSLTLALVLLALTGASPGSAAIGYLWSFEELLTWADIVVIAEHVGGHDAGRSVSPDSDLARVERLSDFTVLVQLKAEAGKPLRPGTAIVVRHWWSDFDQWYKDHPGLTLIGGGDPRDVRFIQGSGPYVLFLKRVDEDLFEPVTHHRGTPVGWAFVLRGPGPTAGEVHYHAPTKR
jgi:hypothetical protein